MDDLVKNFNWIVLVWSVVAAALGVVILMIFRSVFNKLDRNQREMDEELRKHGLR